MDSADSSSSSSSSSSGDEDSTSSSSSSGGGGTSPHEPVGVIPTSQDFRRRDAGNHYTTLDAGRSSGSSDADSASSSSSSSSDTGSDGDSSDSDDDSDGSDRTEDDDLRNEHLLTVAERIKRQEERGVDLSGRRERRQEARKEAVKLLSSVYKKKDHGSNVQQKKNKKKSKHAPTEVSSKRSDFYKRKLDLNANGIGVNLGEHRYKPRDPRVSSLNGHLDMEHYEKNYEFLREMRQKEIALLKKRISARKKTGHKGQDRRRRLGITNDGGSLEEDQAELKRLLQEKAEYERQQVDRAAKRAVKKKLQQEVADGKRGVYFPKRKELKRLHQEAKMEELRKRGGDKAVERAVAKRRKKNKSKDAGLLGGGRA